MRCMNLSRECSRKEWKARSVARTRAFHAGRYILIDEGVQHPSATVSDLPRGLAESPGLVLAQRVASSSSGAR